MKQTYPKKTNSFNQNNVNKSKETVSYTHLDVYKRQFQHQYSELTAKFQHQISSKNKWNALGSRAGRYLPTH